MTEHSSPAPVTPADVEKILAVAPKYGIGIVLPDRPSDTPPSNNLQVKVIGPGEGKIVWAAGDHYTFKVTGLDTGGTYSLFEGSVPPQAGPPPHFHQREIEAFYILEGELTFHSQAGSVTAGPGTYVHIPKNLLHTFKNESNRPVRMLAIVAPAGMEGFLEDIGYTVYDRTSSPAPITPADVEKILAIAPQYGIGIVLENAFAPQVKTTVGDYSQRDAEARVSFYVLLWKRKGISLQVFDDYWRDVHGPVCARLPGQFQYWQFHVGHNEGGAFPAVEGVNYTTTPDDQFDGIAELTFRSVEDRQTWFDAASILMDDEHNIFSKAIGYVTAEGNSKTYVDGMATGDPNGDLDVVKFHVMVRQAPGVATAEFRRYMTDIFASNVVQHDGVLKFRLHLFEPPDLSRPDAAGVVHYEAPEQQYQAAFELAFRNNLDMERFFASQEYAQASEEQSRYVKQFCPFPERDVYTFVYDGFMPLAGQRGSSTAELITRLGATNQLKADIHNLVVGHFPHSRPLAKNGTERSAIPSPIGEPVMANSRRPVQTKKRVNFYEELSADYSTPVPVSRSVSDRMIADAERFIRMKERTLPEITARYSLEVIEEENKEWWPSHCEALRRGRGDLLTAEYHENLVYFCQDGPYYGLEEQAEREKHWWALIAQPGVTMTWPVVMFHGEFVWFEWACIDDETRETIAKGSVSWVRRGHRGGCYFKGEQLTFYRDVFASPELLSLITT